MNKGRIALLATAMAVPLSLQADDHATQGLVDDSTIAAQRDVLARTTAGKGFGPQSPRDIDSAAGNNQRIFSTAPDYDQMNLCNIHFHKHAEHKGGEFTTYAGNGDGLGYGTGYRYSGTLSESERAPADGAICPTEKDSLVPGDTIELHYVHTTAKIEPGPTLGACLSDAIGNPQLRVETQVYVLVNDASARDFGELTELGVVDGYHQALNIPGNTGEPVQYAGSTTGPAYNENGSPLQVSWSVRPEVARVNIDTVGIWCEDNIFDETGAHGVRNLVVNPDLLSEIDS
ncbi:MAG TPA: delta-class carbonic anhydrase [Wenzhouxiangellaceae bacterium]|nr:delta-class carbonic anhydrase [Wenzhouxiangellaceae bacterium]